MKTKKISALVQAAKDAEETIDIILDLWPGEIKIGYKLKAALIPFK